jgi:hypothetical protein
MFKALLLIAALALCTGSTWAKGGAHSERGHVTKSGTYVPPHRATNPDKTKSNKWSQKVNVNSDTGKKGTKE